MVAQGLAPAGVSTEAFLSGARGTPAWAAVDWDAVACERHGKLQSAYSDDPTQAPGERPRFVNPPKDALGAWLSGTNGQASPGGHRSYRQAPQVEGHVEGKLTSTWVEICRSSSRTSRPRAFERARQRSRNPSRVDKNR
jgi:hypothetical protein